MTRITTPTLVIAGDHDPATPAEAHAQVIAASLPGTCLALVHGAHLASVESPLRVAELMLAHCTSPEWIRT